MEGGSTDTIQSVEKRRVGSIKVEETQKLDVLKSDKAFELAEIEQRFAKYVSFSDDQLMIDQFVCPVEGCGFMTDQGPGALRMHMVLTADPKIVGRYDQKHEDFLETNPGEMTVRGVQYLASFPSSIHLDTSIGKIRE